MAKEKPKNSRDSGEPLPGFQQKESIEKDGTADEAESPLKPHKTFRIAVSGDVLLNRLETEIINQPAFQRLRRIKQLGTTDLVYASAQHTRFEHSLGSVHMAETIMQYIELNQHSSKDERKIDPDDRQLVRLVALLHDVANIPFGHTLEDEACVVETYQEDKERYDKIIGRTTPIGELLFTELGEERYQLLFRILTTSKKEVTKLGKHSFIYDIVKNTVCSDLLDYLQRDSYFCNLNLGFGDRFLRYVFITRDPVGVPQETAEETSTDKKATQVEGRRLAIRLWKERDSRPRPDILSELVQLLQARYYLGERVYFHHAKIISSAMLAKAVFHAVHAVRETEKRKELLESFLTIDDADLFEKLKGSVDTIAVRYAQMLKNRNLFKRFYQLNRQQVEGATMTNAFETLGNYRTDPERRTKTETELADQCGLAAGSVIIYCPDPKMNLKQAEMLVTWRDRVVPLKNIDDKLYSEKIKSILTSHENLWQFQVFLDPQYGPGQSEEIDRKRQLLYAWCREFFERDLPHPMDSNSVVRDTIIDIAREDNLRFTSVELDEAAENFSLQTQSRRGSFSRASMKEYVRAHFAN